MKVVGKLPYIVEDVERLWGNREYEESSVRSMINNNLLYHTKISLADNPTENIEIALIGCAVSGSERKVFYLSRDSDYWRLKSARVEDVVYVEVLNKNTRKGNE